MGDRGSLSVTLKPQKQLCIQHCYLTGTFIYLYSVFEGVGGNIYPSSTYKWCCESTLYPDLLDLFIKISVCSDVSQHFPREYPLCPLMDIG